MTDPSPPKQTLLAHLAGVARGLGHEHRLELLELLCQAERNVEALVELTGLHVATVSQHLQQLKRAGLVGTRKQGKFVFYRVADRRVARLLDALRIVAENNVAEIRQLVERYFAGDSDMEGVSRAELLARLERDEITLLDVRPREEYEAGHLPGAINVPVGELQACLDELPADRQIVAYCRGPYCMLSRDAVTLLERHGRQAVRLKTGYPDWTTGPSHAGRA
ncbi:MAG: ArsR/SmtB family transcription factor [Wenzhouxiangella sp.]